MIREYHFARVVYDEARKVVRCAICGDDIKPNTLICRVDGRWSCHHCAVQDGRLSRISESALCRSVQAMLER